MLFHTNAHAHSDTKGIEPWKEVLEAEMRRWIASGVELHAHNGPMPKFWHECAAQDHDRACTVERYVASRRGSDTVDILSR